MKKQLPEIKKKKKVSDKSRKSEKRSMAKKRLGLSEKFEQRGSKKLSAERKRAVINFLSRDENSHLLAGKKTPLPKINRKCRES